MKRVVFETSDQKVIDALLEFAAANGILPEVTDLDEAAARLASAIWLAQRVHAKLAPLDRERHALADVHRRLQWRGSESVERLTGLTLEEFLSQDNWFSKELLEVMADIQVVFADGADPATFPGREFDSREIPERIASPLRLYGVTSWAMLPYLSAAFLRGIRLIRDGRIQELRKFLGQHGLALKGEKPFQ